MAQFDWRNPDFSVQLIGDGVTPQQRVAQYVRKAPKRSKTLRRKPRNNSQTYQWGKDMTFEEKAEMLARGDLRNHVRSNAFIDDLDRYVTPTEQIMEFLETASPRTQKYYGVYDDIVARRAPKNPSYGPYNPKPSTPAKQAPVARRANPGRSSVRPVVQQVPQPTIEPEPLVDRTPLDTTDTTAREWGLWNPTTAMASYQADAALRRMAMQPVTGPLNGVQVPQYGWGGWLPLIGFCE